MAVSEYREIFEHYLTSTGRFGMDALIEWIRATDFYTAPASTAYHGNHAGGLLLHSLNVYRALEELPKAFHRFTIPPESIAITALLHDVCKIGCYHMDKRNRKNEDGKWESVPYWRYEDEWPMGHGEKSAILLLKYISLTNEELAMIRWHMGQETSIYGRTDGFAQMAAVEPNIVALHIADLYASFFMDAKPVK